MNNAQIQIALNAVGFGPLRTDGILGKNSVVAIVAFQRKMGLLADGVPGPKTQAALQRAQSPSPAPGPSVPTPLPATGAVSILTADVIRAILPKARPDLVDVIANNSGLLAGAGIVTKMIAAQFIAQIAVETGGLTSISESLNYSTTGLRATFGSHRISDADCKRLGRYPNHPADQEAIANIVYGGEWGRENLGNTQPGDGWRFRAGGLLQTTGRTNFRNAGHENDPETLRQPLPALTSALQFWASHNLSAVAAQGVVRPVRRIVNGGDNGLDDAEVYFAKAKRVLGI